MGPPWLLGGGLRSSYLADVVGASLLIGRVCGRFVSLSAEEERRPISHFRGRPRSPSLFEWLRSGCRRKAVYFTPTTQMKFSRVAKKGDVADADDGNRDQDGLDARNATPT